MRTEVCAASSSSAELVPAVDPIIVEPLQPAVLPGEGALAAFDGEVGVLALVALVHVVGRVRQLQQRAAAEVPGCGLHPHPEHLLVAWRCDHAVDLLPDRGRDVLWPDPRLVEFDEADLMQAVETASFHPRSYRPQQGARPSQVLG